MLAYVILYNLLLSCVIGNITIENFKNLTLKESREDYNKTKLTVISEGGSVVPDSPVATLPKENHTILSFDKELGKGKERPVVPRKGVVYNSHDDDPSLGKNVTGIIHNNSTIESMLALKNSSGSESNQPSKTTAGKHKDSSQKTSIESAVKPPFTHVNKTGKPSLTVVSEGGSIVPGSSVSTLSNESHAILVSLDKELGKEKERPVVPRKGVVYDPLDDNTLLGNFVTSTKHNSTTESVPIDKKSSESDHQSKKKKPPILSYEALANDNASVNKDELHIPLVNASSDTVSSQIPSPNKKSIPSVKVHPVNVYSHPGMVMPIVITILVVPMFAVLGYMALRRGQEAWKNRHYKRVDFLLDGMYYD